MREINSILEEMIEHGLVDSSASELPIKNGYIQMNDCSRKPWQTFDASEKPVCEVCGTVMLEGWDKVNRQFYWWCPDAECSGKRMQEHMRRKNSQFVDGFDKNAVSIMAGFGVASLYANVTLDSFEDNQRLVENIRIWIANPSANIFLYGGTGTGKTHLASAIIREYARRGAKNMYFKSFSMLLLEIRDTFARHEDDYHQSGEDSLDIIDRYLAYNLLVIDDLGAEKISEYSTTTLYQLIDGRINRNKRTIITSNLSIDEIEKCMDKRISSRLLGFYKLKIDMPDYRDKRNRERIAGRNASNNLRSAGRS